MGKTVTFTMKLDKEVRDALKEFCKDKGFVMKSFVERAILDEIEKEEDKEDLLAIAHYEKYEKGKEIPLEVLAAELREKYGLKAKRKK